jgi:predicted porin
VGTSYTIGNNILFGDYGKGGDSDGSDGVSGINPVSGDFDDVDDYDAFRVGAIHNLSKRTFVYAGYGQNNPDKGDKLQRATIGVRHSF